MSKVQSRRKYRTTNLRQGKEGKVKNGALEYKSIEIGEGGRRVLYNAYTPRVISLASYQNLLHIQTDNGGNIRLHKLRIYTHTTHTTQLDILKQVNCILALVYEGRDVKRERERELRVRSRLNLVKPTIYSFKCGERDKEKGDSQC